MSFADWIQKERVIWHKRFIPSLIAGLAVAVISFFFSFTVSNIVIFASLGSSAAILTHRYIHKLTILRTVILSYFLALMVSLLVLFIEKFFQLPFSLEILIIVTLVTILIYAFDVFHPPAIAAGISFLVVEGDLFSRIVMFFSVIVLLVLIKLLTYAFYNGEVDLKKFLYEFRNLEKKEIKKLNSIFN